MGCGINSNFKKYHDQANTQKACIFTTTEIIDQKSKEYAKKRNNYKIRIYEPNKIGLHIDITSD